MELTVEELEQKLEQQTQDYHFDMRNKQMELVMLQNRLDTLEQGFDDLERENKELRKHQLELVMENGELKDMVLDLGGDYEKHLTKSIDISQLDLFDVSE